MSVALRIAAHAADYTPALVLDRSAAVRASVVGADVLVDVCRGLGLFHDLRDSLVVAPVLCVFLDCPAYGVGTREALYFLVVLLFRHGREAADTLELLDEGVDADARPERERY